MHGSSAIPKITLRVFWKDSDLLEIETHLEAGKWQGLANSYASIPDLDRDSQGLLRWTEKSNCDFKLEIGSEMGAHGWLCLRWYPIDKIGHIMCHARIATMDQGKRPEEISRMSVELATEPGLIVRFARQLRSMVESLQGEAVLEGVLGFR